MEEKTIAGMISELYEKVNELIEKEESFTAAQMLNDELYSDGVIINTRPVEYDYSDEIASVNYPSLEHIKNPYATMLSKIGKVIGLTDEISIEVYSRFRADIEDIELMGRLGFNVVETDEGIRAQIELRDTDDAAISLTFVGRKEGKK